MDFGLTDEQQLLVESLKEYADRYFDDESVRQMYENHQDRKSTRLNSSHITRSRMPSSA